MATPRKRPTPGFSAKVEDLEKKEEQEDLGKLLEEAADEILSEEPKLEEVEITPSPVPILEEIVPTDFPSERFVSSEEPKIEPKKASAPEEVKPKRHPRNVPKFARLAK